MNIKDRDKRVRETRRQQQAEEAERRTTEHGKPPRPNPNDPKKEIRSGWGGGITDRDRVMVEYGWWVGRISADSPNADDVAKGPDRLALIRKELGLHLETIGTDFNPRVPAVPVVPHSIMENATADISMEVSDGLETKN